jgi:hypothetical protein
MPNAHQG